MWVEFEPLVRKAPPAPQPAPAPSSAPVPAPAPGSVKRKATEQGGDDSAKKKAKLVRKEAVAVLQGLDKEQLKILAEAASAGMDLSAEVAKIAGGGASSKKEKKDKKEKKEKKAKKEKKV